MTRRRLPRVAFPAAAVAMCALAAALLVPGHLLASEARLSGNDGHPRGRFPLAVYATPSGDAGLDATIVRAVGDWNGVFAEALGVAAFRSVEQAADAAIIVTFEPRGTHGLMGQASLHVDEKGTIELPVRVALFEPTARGQTTRETVLYQVVAHELGHALGLPHTPDPRSLMCCVDGSVDFNDPQARAAYIAARRHPDVRSVRDQLSAQYRRFWEREAPGPRP